MAFRKVFGSALQALRGEQVLFIQSRNGSKCINNVQLLGRVGKEPVQVGESRLMFFPFVTEENRRMQDGTMTSTSTWHRIVVAQPFLIEKICPVIVKGHRVFLEGSLYYRNSESGDKTSYILARQVILLERPLRYDGKENEMAQEISPEEDLKHAQIKE